MMPATLVEPMEVISRFRDHNYSLHDFLSARIERQPTACALEFDASDWTYKELGELAGRWAGWLSARGVGAGDRVAVMAVNHPHTIGLLFALARLGAILVPVNPDYGTREAAYVLGHAGVKGVVATPDKLDIVTAALTGTLPDAWTAAIGPELEGELSACMVPEISAGTADMACLIIYTSGTTGFPKGAMHSQRGFLLTAEAFDTYGRYLRPDGLLIVHISNRYLNLRPVLAAEKARGWHGEVMVWRASQEELDRGLTHSIWVLMSKSPETISKIKTLYPERGWEMLDPEPGFRPWTDDYASILPTLKVLRD